MFYIVYMWNNENLMPSFGKHLFHLIVLHSVQVQLISKADTIDQMMANEDDSPSNRQNIS